ncbi:MAG: hypothetical protein LUC83_00035 [Clostridiales bacterium]|nr:hypothetical protein [Clostridiales bacterium]
MRKWFLVMGACLVLLLSGCDQNEPEKDAFPLALGIESEGEGVYHMYMAYPDLSDADASENALAKDAFWDGTMENLAEGTEQMSRSSSRNVDMNHLKVLILDGEMLDGKENAQKLIEFFREKRDASWNAYVFLTDIEMAELFSEKVQTGSCMGIYLEDIVEGWDNIKSGSLVTVGDLVSQYYNATERLLIPVVTVADGAPAVAGFREVENMTAGEERSTEEVFALYDSLVLYHDTGTKKAMKID